MTLFFPQERQAKSLVSTELISVMIIAFLSIVLTKEWMSMDLTQCACNCRPTIRYRGFLSEIEGQIRLLVLLNRRKLDFHLNIVH